MALRRPPQAPRQPSRRLLRGWLGALAQAHAAPPRRLKFTREGKFFVGITLGRGLRRDQHRQQPPLPAPRDAPRAHRRERHHERALAARPHRRPPPPAARAGRPRAPRRDRGLQPQEARSPRTRSRSKTCAPGSPPTSAASSSRSARSRRRSPPTGAPRAARARRPRRLPHRHALPLRPLREVARGPGRGGAHHLPRGRSGRAPARRRRANRRAATGSIGRGPRRGLPRAEADARRRGPARHPLAKDAPPSGRWCMRERARETRPDVTLAARRRPKPADAGDDWDAAFERRIRDVASRAVAHLKRGDTRRRRHQRGRRRARRPRRRAPIRSCATSRSSRRSRDAPSTPPRRAASRRGRDVRFGLVHRVMTDALAALGVLAVVSTALDARWTQRRCSSSASPLALAIPEELADDARRSGTSRPSARSRSSSSQGRAPRSRALAARRRRRVRRAAPDHPPRDAARRRARPADHRPRAPPLRRRHRARRRAHLRALLPRLPRRRARARSSSATCAARSRATTARARAIARVCPSTCRASCGAAASSGGSFLAATCLLSIPIFLFTATLFVLFPRVGLSLLLLNHPPRGAHDRLLRHVDLGRRRRAARRPVDRAALRRSTTCADRPPAAPDAPPARHRVRRLRRTRLGAHASAIAQARVPQHGRPLPARRASRPRCAIASSRSTSSPSIRRSSSCPRASSRCASRAQGQVAPRRAARHLPGPEDELRYGGSDARGLHYDAFLAGRPGGARRESLPGSERARYLGLPGSPVAHRRARPEVDGRDRRSPTAKANAIEDHLRKEYRYDLNSPSGRRSRSPSTTSSSSRSAGTASSSRRRWRSCCATVGIPSRNVTGFVGGTCNRFGQYYAVREGDAHSWVEAYIDDLAHPALGHLRPHAPRRRAAARGDDRLLSTCATASRPVSQRWNRYVVSYDLRKQMRLFESSATATRASARGRGSTRGRSASSTRAPVVAGALLSRVRARLRGLEATTRRRRRAEDAGRRSPPTADARDRDGALSRPRGGPRSHGITRPASLPPLRHAEDLRARNHPLGDEVLALTNVYLEARFGGSPTRRRGAAGLRTAGARDPLRWRNEAPPTAGVRATSRYGVTSFTPTAPREPSTPDSATLA